MHTYAFMLLGLATIALGAMRFAPWRCTVLVKIQAASPLFTQTEDSSTCRQPGRAVSERVGHEPVCLVPGSVDKYLPVPDCILQTSLDTHSEGLLLF